MARGRPVWTFSASREWSMTDWWYCQNQYTPRDGAEDTNLIGAMGEVHADHVETSCWGSVSPRVCFTD